MIFIANCDKSSEFYLDRVYGPNTNTKQIYDQLAAPLVKLALDGGIGTLFAYGQTGSGKTFTVSVNMDVDDS